MSRDRFEASTIADAVTSDPANAGRSLWNIAYFAAMQGYLSGIASAGQTVEEMAADHEHAGEGAKAAVLREAQVQIATLPDDLP